MKKEYSQVSVAVHCQSLLLFHIICVARVERKTGQVLESVLVFLVVFWVFFEGEVASC